MNIAPPILQIPSFSQAGIANAEGFLLWRSEVRQMFEDGQKITWFGVTAILAGIIGAYLISHYVDFWAIETICR